jgi:hypothetical protein
MPCVATARGTRATVAYPGWSTPSAQPLPFNDAINNTPCARKIVTSVNGVNVAAVNLCPEHWMQANGDQFYIAPIVLEP